MYLLDTDVLVGLLRGNSRVKKNIDENHRIPKAFSIISFGELLYGCHKSQHAAENLTQVRRLTSCYPVINISRPIMERFAEMKAILSRSGVTIEDFDLLIGCTALTMDYIMVTNNFKHYSKIPGLKIVNWS